MWKSLSLCLFMFLSDFMSTADGRSSKKIELLPSDKDSGGCEPNPQVYVVVFSDRVLFVTDYAAGIKETVHLRYGLGTTVFYTKLGNRYQASFNAKAGSFTLWSVQYGCHWEGKV